MADETEVTPAAITSRPAGPLLVSGAVPVRRKSIVYSEHGEPMTWKSGQTLRDEGVYALCRCGDSNDKPFCDGSHFAVDFEGADTADSTTYDDRSSVLGGTGITVRDDRSICVHAGFCGNRVSNIWSQVADTGDALVRIQVINEIEKCPSGALTYRMEGAGDDLEPDYPTQVAVTDDGPLWVTGHVEITTADGTVIESRDRVTLCRCGASGNKPLCDGSHKEAGFEDS